MSFVSDFFKDISGRTARDASKESGRMLQQAGQDAARQIGETTQQSLGYFSPYEQVGQQGLEQAGFLGDSQAQYDWLQNNPLFSAALENANRTTQASSAASGRLSAGDTLAQLSNNVLLSGMPLIDRQRQDIYNQLNYGQGIAGQQANLLQGSALNQANYLTSGASGQAAGLVGAANAMGQGASGLFNIAGSLAPMVGGMFSGSSAPAASGISNNTFNSSFSGQNLLGTPSTYNWRG